MFQSAPHDTAIWTVGGPFWRSLISLSDSCEPRTLWLSRLVILAFAGVMFVATWASWPDLIIDGGRELYVPWAMLQGKQLYRDLWYPYGPLAPSVFACC